MAIAEPTSAKIAHDIQLDCLPGTSATTNTPHFCGVVGTPELKIELSDSPYIIAQREQEKQRAVELATQQAKRQPAPKQTSKTAIVGGDNVAIGQRLAAEAGWTGEQWTCLYNLWQKESSWKTNATNGRTWGIPQSLPGHKMASAGADWRTNPETQVRWGIGYIKDRYGSACKAWQHSQARNWY